MAIIDTRALGHANFVAAYLVTGKETALIDMGYQSSAEIVSKDLTEHGIDPGGLDYLLPTHVHLDHSGSCGGTGQEIPKSLDHRSSKGRATSSRPIGSLEWR